MDLRADAARLWRRILTAAPDASRVALAQIAGVRP